MLPTTSRGRQEARSWRGPVCGCSLLCCRGDPKWLLLLQTSQGLPLHWQQRWVHGPPSLARFSATAKSKNSVNLSYDVRFYTQTLDHFSFLQSRNGTFQQRYLIEDNFWGGAESQAPIFLYCGNEGDIEWFAVNTGFLWEIAPQFRALLVFPEHRYYGESMPYGSRELAYKDAASLAHLTSEQALADYVILIRDLKRNLSAEASPVVLFGGSYGGMLAAWFRLKYPHVAIGALASSAPILQFEDIVPSDTFYRIVSSNFKKESQSCFDVIRQSWDEIESLGEQNGGLHNLSIMFRACRDFKGTWELEDWLDSAYAYLAMVNYPYAADFLMPLPAFPIKEVCKAIDGLPDGSSVLSRVFAGVSVYYNYTGAEDCFDPGDDPHGMSGWGWQACTEMVMPMSSNPANSMFPPYSWNYSLYEHGCLETYGVKPRPNWITSEFGGQNIETALKHFGSNIVFSNGLLDPWSGGSVLRDISDTIVASVVSEGAHHLDLRQSTQNDPPWLVQQRKSEIQYIMQWLHQYYADKQTKAEIQAMHPLVGLCWAILLLLLLLAQRLHFTRRVVHWIGDARFGGRQALGDMKL